MKRGAQIENDVGSAKLQAFKNVVRTQSGATFDPSAARWSYRDGVTNVSLDFDALEGATEEFVRASKAVLAWYAENRSPDHLSNMFQRLKHFAKARASHAQTLTSIGADDLINYRASLDETNAWYLSTFAGLLRRWHRLGYAGVDDDAVLLLKQLRLHGNRKGEAVLTMDPNEGPFTYLELEGLQAALNAAYAEGRVNTEQFVLAWLYMLLGQRNTQHAVLKVCDVRLVRNEDGEPTYSIMMPRAKQRHRDLRDEFTERPLIEQFGEILYEYAERLRQEFATALPDAGEAPLFPSRASTRWSDDYKFHQSSSELGQILKAVLESLEVVSERTAQKLKILPVRFRRTIGTRAAEEGYGPLVIAKLLDHTDTQNVMVYSANSPAIIDRIDRSVAMGMAPLAQAFAGVVVDGLLGEHDPAQRIIDLRIDRSGEAMGECGRHGFCGFNAPIACYTCKSFEAWLEGPHEAVLSYLIQNRERLLNTSDKRIACINDRTIFAVAAVIQRCAEFRAEQSVESVRTING